MTNKKIIAVVGATGAQGGGLVRAILNDTASNFTVRALTRNPHSDKAEGLRKLGVEVVAADLDDSTSLERAFAGAYGAFCVTNFWEHMSPERETAQARKMAQAAKTAKLQHVIWSTLEDTRQWVPLHDSRVPTLLERYKVPHCDAKGEANQFFSDLGVPTTFLHTSFYWENFLMPGAVLANHGGLHLTLPMGDYKLPGIAVEDIGKCAYGIFQRGSELVGKSIGVAGEHLTGEEMAAILSKMLGQTIAYQDILPGIPAIPGFPMIEDVRNQFQMHRDFNQPFRAMRDVELSRLLNPALQSFAGWLTQNQSRIAVG